MEEYLPHIVALALSSLGAYLIYKDRQQDNAKRIYPGGVEFRNVDPQYAGNIRLHQEPFTYFFQEYAASVNTVNRKATYEEMDVCFETIKLTGKDHMKVLGALLALNFFETPEDLIAFCNRHNLMATSLDIRTDILDVVVTYLDFGFLYREHITLVRYHGVLDMSLFIRNLVAFFNVGMLSIGSNYYITGYYSTLNNLFYIAVVHNSRITNLNFNILFNFLCNFCSYNLAFQHKRVYKNFAQCKLTRVAAMPYMDRMKIIYNAFLTHSRRKYMMDTLLFDLINKIT